MSACIHAVVILFTPAARFRPKRIEFPPLYEVQLVEIEPERPKTPPKKPVVRPKEEKPKVTPPPVKPKKEEPEKPKVPEKPVKEEKKEEAKPPPVPPRKVQTEAKIEVDVPLWYQNVVHDTVNRHWDEPLVGADGVVETVVYFQILKSGEVASPQIEESSGDRRWDLAALRAVVESRFPPWPPEVKEVIGVLFSFKHEAKTAS